MTNDTTDTQTEGGWQPIETAPDMERVIVAGWSERSGNVAAYWWMHEDFIMDGDPQYHAEALLWHPFPTRPTATPSSLGKA